MKRRSLLLGSVFALPVLFFVFRRYGWPFPDGSALDALRTVLDGLPIEAVETRERLWGRQPWYLDRIAVAEALWEGWKGQEPYLWLIDCIHADYTEERVHWVDGWLLSRTELRLLLLAARPP